jgi:hypothetical protein
MNMAEHFAWQRGQKSTPTIKLTTAVREEPIAPADLVITPPVTNAPSVSKHLVSKQDVSKQADSPYESARVRKWQKENREKYNEGKREYMREWQRKKRAKA